MTPDSPALLNIGLYAPRIAQNVGQIGRTCFAMGLSLNLIRPFGFRLDARELRRAGVGYWDSLDPTIYPDGEAYWDSAPPRTFLVTKHGERSYLDVEFRPGDGLLFGNETEGFPPAWLEQRGPQTIRIPMLHPEARCLNLATSVSVVAFEALRKMGGIS